MFRRVILALTLLGVVPVSTVILLGRWADAAGAQVGREAAAWCSKLPRGATDQPATQERNQGVIAGPLAEAVAPAARSASKRATNPRRKGAKPVANAASGVFVPASAVLNLARVGLLPQAAAVPAAGSRPAGLKLSGVGGLGLGMRDGDVLTRVAGVPVASVSQVIALVVQAREKRARHIGAEFFRDGLRWSLTVEQPYL
ncbi:MAG TPA: hypothetical protein VER33_17060 [Polyangiaceae bacterium]|nr:hypothetical protein [Polyangiaceae bacterium]